MFWPDGDDEESQGVTGNVKIHPLEIHHKFHQILVITPPLDQKQTKNLKIKIIIMLRYLENVLPDRVSGAIAVNPAVVIQDDVHLQVSIIVMSGEVVGDDPRRDAQTAQDWNTEVKTFKDKHELTQSTYVSTIRVESCEKVPL